MSAIFRRAILIIAYSSAGLGLGVGAFLDEYQALPTDGSTQAALCLAIVGFTVIAADKWISRRAKCPPDAP